MKKGNTTASFHKAKKNKNDEFYTRLETIEKELQYYKPHFRGKIIYLNCDKEWSNFYKYFKDNKEFLGVKEIIRTSSDFRLPENIENLKRADIVVTNPPFSLWREYVAQLMEYKKKFLILGGVISISYKNIFPHLKNEDFWLSPRGQSTEEFNLVNGETQKVRGITWYTNLDCGWRTKEKLLLIEKYTPEKYPKYDNYDAINVDRTKDIPKDYYGEMGVPITFLDKHNPKQFEIIDTIRPSINKKNKFKRLIIKRRKE